MGSLEDVWQLGSLRQPEEKNRHKEFWKAPGISNGVPRGGVVELRGTSSAEWFIEFLKLNTELDVFWTESEEQALPFAVFRPEVHPNRLTFASIRSEPALSLRRLIQSEMYEVILFPTTFMDEKVLQALHIFASIAGCTLFLIQKGSNARKISMIQQIEVEKTPEAYFKVIEAINL